MGGVHAVLEVLRHRQVFRYRSAHPANRRGPAPEPLAEGMLYLTPSGEGYVLYAAPHPDRQAA